MFERLHFVTALILFVSFRENRLQFTIQNNTARIILAAEALEYESRDM